MGFVVVPREWPQMQVFFSRVGDHGDPKPIGEVPAIPRQ